MTIELSAAERDLLIRLVKLKEDDLSRSVMSLKGYGAGRFADLIASHNKTIAKLGSIRAALGAAKRNRRDKPVPAFHPDGRAGI